jgi:hypothetical protein
VTEDAGEGRFDHFELVATVLLAVAARVESTRAANVANRQGQIDFASALFFAGISTRLRSSTTRMVVLGLGCALFLGSVIWIATFPVSLSV